MAENSSVSNIFSEVSKKSDILKVVSYFLGQNHLVRKGKIYYAICPFHPDTNPSMQINLQRNNFHCFVCGTMGDSIRFVELYCKVSKWEALKKVCEICSLPLPEESGRKTGEISFEKQYATELNALLDLKKFYSLSLLSSDGEACRKYLENRKIPKEVVEHFSLGYAPKDQKQSIQALRKLGYEIKTLTRAGILSDSASFEDRYQDRLMFPIYDNYGHLVAFSGRILEKGQDSRKYINYPETKLFIKNQILYHFDQAKDSAKKHGYLYLVEGFMDVIALVRAGVLECAGTMGTALSHEHLHALKKLGVEVRLCLDSDEAGQLGEESACQTLLEAKIPFRIVRKFKNYKDADEVLTNEGKETLVKELNRLYDPVLFFLRRTCKDRNSLSDTVEIQAYLKKVAPYFYSLDPISQEKDIEVIKNACTLSEETIRKVLQNYRDGTHPQKEFKEFKEENQQSEFEPKRRFYPKARVTRDPVMMGDKYLLGEKMNEYFEEVKQIASSSRQELFPLYKNEASILLQLPLSRIAYQILDERRVDFEYPPFGVLSRLIGEEYFSEPLKKTPFGKGNYLSLEERIQHFNDEPEVDEEDPFGVEETHELLEDKEISLLLKSVALSKEIGQEGYSKEQFETLLTLHPLYVEYANLVKRMNLQGTEDTASLIEKTNLRMKIKKAGGNI